MAGNHLCNCSKNPDGCMTDSLPMPITAPLTNAQRTQLLNLVRRAAKAEIMPRFRLLAVFTFCHVASLYSYGALEIQNRRFSQPK